MRRFQKDIYLKRTSLNWTTIEWSYNQNTVVLLSTKNDFMIVRRFQKEQQWNQDNQNTFLYSTN